MKMKAIHYDLLEQFIKNINKDRILAYIEHLKTDPRVKDINKRLRWDIYYLMVKSNRTLQDELYTYLNDSHIDTALKQAMNKCHKLKDTN